MSQAAAAPAHRGRLGNTLSDRLSSRRDGFGWSWVGSGDGGQRLPEAAQPCPAAVETKWDLWRAGTRLRGVNTWQKTVEGEDGQAAVTYTYKPEDFTELTTFKANYVNLSFPGIYSVKPKGGRYVLEPKVLTELTQLVERLDRANLFVVVSFRTGPGRSESVFGGEDGEEVVTDVWKSESEAARRAWVETWLKASDAGGRPRPRNICATRWHSSNCSGPITRSGSGSPTANASGTTSSISGTAPTSRITGTRPAISSTTPLKRTGDSRNKVFPRNVTFKPPPRRG